VVPVGGGESVSIHFLLGVVQGCVLQNVQSKTVCLLTVGYQWLSIKVSFSIYFILITQS